jgi:hypothetical protein
MGISLPLIINQLQKNFTLKKLNGILLPLFDK